MQSPFAGRPDRKGQKNSMSSSPTQIATLLESRHANWAARPHRKTAACSRLAYRIAGISLEMSAGDGLQMVLEPSLRAFAMVRAAGEQCDVQVNVSMVEEL